MGAADFSLVEEQLQLGREPQHRFPRPEILDPYPVPIGGRMAAGAERLGEGFLGREAFCQVRDRLSVRPESLEFRFAKYALRYAFAEALEHPLAASDLD